MNRIGSVCGIAALVYLTARFFLTKVADLLLSARVPGASLTNPAGTGVLEAAFLRMVISALALAAPFLLLQIHPLPKRLSLRPGRCKIGSQLFLVFWSAVLLGNFTSALLHRFGPNDLSRIQLPSDTIQLCAAWIAICLLPAVGEELLFRGLMQGWLAPYGAAAIVGPAVLFSLLHGTPSACVAALFAGLALGYCAMRSGSLLYGILFHLYNNTLAFVSQYSGQYWGPETQRMITLCFFLLPPLLCIGPALHSKMHCVHPFRLSWRSAFWLLRCPGWLCSAGFLLIFCICSI